MLRDAYATYLRAGATPAAARELVPVVGGAIGERLAGYGSDDSVGPLPPTTTNAGARWFDTVELTESLLVERDGQTTWCALHPVSRWQFGGFVDTARIERVQPGALDPTRRLDGDEREPVHDLVVGEAWLYLHWLGKLFADVWTRRSAQQLVGDIWSSVRCEWIGAGDDDDGGALVTPDTLGSDREDEARDEAGEDRIDRAVVVPANERVAGATFRTAVPNVYGVFMTDIASELHAGARVMRRYGR